MTKENTASEEVEVDESVTPNENENLETENENEASTEEVKVEETDVDDKDAQIEQLKTQLQEEENRRLRTLADLDNARRRANLDKEAMQKYRAQEVLTHLIPVLDNFQRGLSVQAESEDAKNLLTGMEMVYRSLEEALKSEGLTEIKAEGEEFDPNFHQAVMTDSDDSQKSGVVLEVMQKGYTLKDRVLRPAMVKVNE